MHVRKVRKDFLHNFVGSMDACPRDQISKPYEPETWHANVIVTAPRPDLIEQFVTALERAAASFYKNKQCKLKQWKKVTRNIAPALRRACYSLWLTINERPHGIEMHASVQGLMKKKPDIGNCMVRVHLSPEQDEPTRENAPTPEM